MILSNGTLRIFNAWALLECDDNIGKMYRALYSLEYFYKPKIQKPLWGTHISIIRGETTDLQSKIGQVNGFAITFGYLPRMSTNGVHFYLPVICPLLDTIRLEAGLDKSCVSYHMSVGNICDSSGNTPKEIYL